MESDNELKDFENVPMIENIDDYFAREVLPFAENAWYEKKKMKVGYEIPFTKYFFEYKNTRSISDITMDIIKLEKETDGLLKEIIS
jgi:type I restriction enzyme M protein